MAVYLSAASTEIASGYVFLKCSVIVKNLDYAVTQQRVIRKCSYKMKCQCFTITITIDVILSFTQTSYYSHKQTFLIHTYAHTAPACFKLKINIIFFFIIISPLQSLNTLLVIWLLHHDSQKQFYIHHHHILAGLLSLSVKSNYGKSLVEILYSAVSYLI